VIRRFVLSAIVSALLALPAAAQDSADFSAGSDATSWNLYAESPARFAATVVDLTCSITGDCPADCGAGRRQLALLRTADQALIYPMKNAQPVFSGAAAELLPYCGQAVEVDGLLITDPGIGAQNVYLLQRIRAEGAADWVKANQWTTDWAAKNPAATGDGPWFRRDPRVNAMIAADGYFGLGAARDAALVQELFE